MSGQGIQRIRGIESEIRAPYAAKHQVHAELAMMVRRGEIAYAFNARRDGAEYVVNFIRLTDPPSRTRWYVGAPLAALGGIITVGAMLYNARHVIADALLIGLGVALAACAISAVVAIASSVGGSSSHCPGAFHK